MAERKFMDAPKHTQRIYPPMALRSETESTETGDKTYHVNNKSSRATSEPANLTSERPVTPPASKNKAKKKDKGRKKPEKLDIDYSTHSPAGEKLYDGTAGLSAAATAEGPHKVSEEDDDDWDEDGVEMKIPVSRLAITRADKGSNLGRLSKDGISMELFDAPAGAPVKRR